MILGSFDALFAVIWPWREKGPCFLQSHIICSSRHLLSTFQPKTFPLNPILQVDAIIVKILFYFELEVLLHLTFPLYHTYQLLIED